MNDAMNYVAARCGSRSRQDSRRGTSQRARHILQMKSRARRSRVWLRCWHRQRPAGSFLLLENLFEHSTAMLKVLDGMSLCTAVEPVAMRGCAGRREQACLDCLTLM
ncbi:MAG TPA: hypothetical protein VJT13_13775 [Xanthobacteraceae bacterium]|nr:hypothetical protein [Xanthobacteraceae bacterium]